ncbi:MAG: nicotinate-nucleotide adenylyltransferase [Thermodesulfobacteriota bacterium]
MKIGLIGGTFNPVHLGHLRAGEETKEILGLDEICFVPALTPPHKKTNSIAGASHRLNMLKFAVDGNPAFKVLDMELKRKPPSYTIDTLKKLKSGNPDNKYYFILGTELFARIDTWKSSKSLFKYADFVILNRPGYYEIDLSHLLPLALKNEFQYSYKENKIDVFEHKNSNKLIFINIDGIKLSSTKIRSLIHENKSIKYLVPEKIEKYILDNRLYTEE